MKLSTLSALAAGALLLGACGTAASPAGGGTGDGEGTTGGMAMCAPGVTDCDDMATGDEPTDGDRIMAPTIYVVDDFGAGVSFVEMSHTDNAFPVFIREARVNGATVDVLFSGGEAPCFWVSGVETEETDDAVTITVLAGGEEGADCDSQSISDQAVTVTLKAPLGQRELLDGSRTPGQPNT